MLDAAKSLVQMGLPIIPLCSHDHKHASPKHVQLCNCPGKVPLIREWQGHKETKDEHLAEWARTFKGFNIGLPLGEASGYCGIDVDGDFGEIKLQEMSQGDLPETWQFSTGNGRRLLYMIPPGTKTKKFKQSKKEGDHEECALLCSGQQTVLPPSIHHTGKKYEWDEGYSPWDIDCADAPDWLMQLIVLDEEGRGTFTLDLNSSGKATQSRSIDDEFNPTAFSDELPTTMSVIERRQAKTQKSGSVGKSGHKIVVDEELLSQPIPQGQRDNTMTAIIGHYCANRDLRRLGKDFILQAALNHNQKFCEPPLEEQAIIDKVNTFWEAEQLKEAKYQEAKGEKAPPFEPSKMAAVVRAQLREKNVLIHFDQGSKMYYYTSPEQGPWKSTRNITLVNKWIRQVLISPGFGHPSWDKQSHIEETRRALEEAYTTAFKSDDDFDLGAHSDKLMQYIVVNDGMLEWETGALLPWDPKYMTTVSFDVDYDSDADCPRFKQFITQWLPDEDVRKVVQEYLGYCLVPNTKFRKALFLYGKGKNGKSMLLEFLQDFFGDHKATLSYDALFQRFGPANLKDKLVNIYDDTSVSFVKDTGIAKNLIAGGTIAAEFKGRDHFIFTNVARFIFSAQETPKTSDHTEAWYDRWIFVKFPNKFRPSNEMKVAIQRAMAEERSGIFNWMVEGLRRLITNDGFTDSNQISLNNDQYRGNNDSVALFVANMCKKDPKANGGTTINTLFRIYSAWSEVEGLRPISKRVFAERIEDLGFHKLKAYADGKSGQTVVAGLFLDKDSEDYAENRIQYNLAESNK